MNKLTAAASLLVFIQTLALPARADEAAIRQALEDYIKAFNEKDIETVATTWTENAIHTDRETGERTEGRAAIAADIAATFKERPTTVLAASIDRIRLIKPDVASVDGQTQVSSPDDEPVDSAFSAIIVSQEGKWQIDSVEEMPLPSPTSPMDALRDLEWLVGHWVDASDDARIDTNIRWSPNHAFLVRSFLVQTTDGQTQEGTEVIGWDPRSRQVRSWTFHSDGSFGDAMWSRNGDEWLIKSSHVLADGQAASGTFVLIGVDDNTITLQLVGHEIEGEPQPARDPVNVVRVQDEEPPASVPTAGE